MVGDLRSFDRTGEVYERIGVPAIFAASASYLVHAAALRPGERVLDVGCGTGVVTRLAAERVGAGGAVAGLDVAEGMLAVARSKPAPAGAPVEWRQGDAAALPFPDGAFDAVLCQQALQFVPDRAAALREMRRVLAAGGRAAIIAARRGPQQEALAPVLARFLGPEAVAALNASFALADGDELEALVRGAGFGDVVCQAVTLPARFASVDDLLAFHVTSGRIAPAAAALAPGEREALVRACRDALAAHFVGGAGEFQMESHLVLARP